MKNGWYDFKQKEFNNKIVYVHGDIITATKNEFNGNVENVKMDITPSMMKKMVILEMFNEFNGLGLA
jgi:hypothetical protein